MAGGETSGGLLLVAASEVFVEEEVICVMWVSGSDTMQDKRIKRELCGRRITESYLIAWSILLHHDPIYITILDSKML
jgi:hypothetical protein